MIVFIGCLVEPGWLHPDQAAVTIPETWEVWDQTGNGITLVHRGRRQSVTVSCRMEHDGKRWLHASIASPARPITWADLRFLRTLLPKDRSAIQVFPREGEYVDTHPNCFHLWACLDDDPIPSFARVDPVTGRLEI